MYIHCTVNYKMKGYLSDEPLKIISRLLFVANEVLLTVLRARNQKRFFFFIKKYRINLIIPNYICFREYRTKP